jgi:hypothetical protein
MAPPTVDGFYASAQVLARMALQAHAHGKPYVALFAGTSLEHLAKACLTSQSPVLITELRAESSFPSLLLLAGVPLANPSPLRTVGLRGALDRLRYLVPRADPKAVATLVDLRDGTVHGADDHQAEARIIAAFVKHTDALVAYLGRDRADFWGDRLGVADVLLAGARTEVEHLVGVRLADARANFQAIDEQLLPALRHLAESRAIDDDQARARCPACASPAVLTGFRDVGAIHYVRDEHGNIVQPAFTVLFSAESLACPVCGLRLDSPEELDAAGLESLIDEGPQRVDELSPIDDGDAAFERWREEG